MTKKLLSLAAIALAASAAGQAAVITKLATGTDVAAGGSWIGGTAPSAADVATWSGSSLGGILEMLSAQSWQGINVQGATSDITIGISAGPALTLGSSGITLGTTGTDLTLNSNLTLGANQAWNVDLNRTLTISGAISGANEITKSGLGTLILSGTNSTSETLTTSGGFTLLTGTNTGYRRIKIDTSTITSTLRISGQDSIGTTPSINFVGTTGVLTSGTNSLPITLNTDITIETNSGTATFGDATATGNITINAISRFSGGSRRNVIVNGTITLTARTGFANTDGSNGTTTFFKEGTGTLAITTAGSNGTGYCAYQVTQGTLAAVRFANVGSNSSFERSSRSTVKGRLIVNGGATLALIDGFNGNSSTDRSLQIGTNQADAVGTIANNATTNTFSFTGAEALTFDTSNQTRTLALAGSNTGLNRFERTIVNNGTGATSVTKNGSGNWILSGANTYTGATTINAGRLTTESAGALGASAVTVSGGTLKTTANLTGIASMTVNSGTLDTSTNSVTTTGAFVLAGGTWKVAATINSLIADSFNLSGGTIDLALLSTTNKQNSGFSLISAIGSGTSSLTNSNFINGLSGYTYSVSTAGVLMVTPVPEPSTYGLLGAGALALAAFVRRRRKAV